MIFSEIGPVTKGFGETPHTHGVGCWIVACAVPNLVVSTVLMAFTVTTLGVGATGGAAYSPLGEIVPTVAFPPGMSLTDQVTAVFDGPVTVAVNC